MKFYAWKRTEAERSIIYAGGLAGSSLAEINKRLAEIGARPMPETSYNDVRNVYVPYFLGDLRRLDAAIKHPPSRGIVCGVLRAEGRRVA